MNNAPAKVLLVAQPPVAGTAPIRRFRIARLPLVGQSASAAPAKAS